MTRKHAAAKLMEWVKRHPRIRADASKLKTKGGKCESMLFSLVEYSEDGATPCTTLCYEVLPPGTSEEAGWREIVKRACSGRLTVDQFDSVGLGGCSSVEEFVLKLEIAG